jgi:hypothetical protein
VNIAATDTELTIRLSPWEKLVSLHGDVRILWRDVTAASVEPDALGAVAATFKTGLRIPGYRYLATADRRRHFIAVRRGEPALHLTVNGERIRELTVSAPDAERLAQRVGASGP